MPALLVLSPAANMEELNSSTPGGFGLWGDGRCPGASEGFLAMGGGIFWGFFWAWGFPEPCWLSPGAAAGRWPETFINSATRFFFRLACASADDEVSITNFLELFAKMKLAVEAGDLCNGDSWPSFVSPGVAVAAVEGVGRVSRFLAFLSAIPRPGASLEDKVEAFKRTALWSGFEGEASLEADEGPFKDSDLRIGFWGATCAGLLLAPEPVPFCSTGDFAISGLAAGLWASMLIERRRTICSREGVTIGRLASSFGMGLLLLRDTGSFLRSEREPPAGFLRLA